MTGVAAMNKSEMLMEEYTKYNYKWDASMPPELGGLCVGNTIFLNPILPATETAQWIAEEIQHQETSVGDIINQNNLNNRRQEKLARTRSYQMLISLDGLIACHENGYTEIDDVCEFFGVTPAFLWKAIHAYDEKYGPSLDYVGYHIDFSHGININKKPNSVGTELGVTHYTVGN